MLKVTLSQDAASEAVDPARCVPGVGNPGHGRSLAGPLKYLLTCGNVRTSTRLAQSFAAPFCR